MERSQHWLDNQFDLKIGELEWQMVKARSDEEGKAILHSLENARRLEGVKRQRYVVNTVVNTQ